MAIPAMLRFYAATVGAGLLFAALALFRAPSRSREVVAVLSATVCFAVGALWIAAVIANGLAAAGVARWKISALLLAVALAPGALLYLSPLWGATAFALMIPLALLLCTEPARESTHAR